MAKYQGTGKVSATDYKSVKWIGMSKGGQAVTISMDEAINLGNIDWTFAEKNETVAEIIMTAVYKNTDATSTDTTEPWTLEIDGEVNEGASGIILGVGVFCVNEKAIALTRGGGKFTVEREFREINADGDRGPVKDRIEMVASRATLSMNALTILDRLTELYTGVSSTT